MNPPVPFPNGTAICLHHAADHRLEAQFRRDMWSNAVWERGRDYSRAGNWWWPMPRRAVAELLRNAR